MGANKKESPIPALEVTKQLKWFSGKRVMEPYKSSGHTGKSKSHDVAKVQSAWRSGGWEKQLLGKLET